MLKNLRMNLVECLEHGALELGSGCYHCSHTHSWHCYMFIGEDSDGPFYITGELCN